VKCKHCDEPVGNRVVVMGNDSIYCYTCGRLEADQSCRGKDVNQYVRTIEELGRREA
jgi:hypothetical protein